MRILFAIPHFYDPGGGGAYGSLKPDPAPRLRALATTIGALHCTFGDRQGFLNGRIETGNAFQSATIEVVICTTGDRHLVNRLGLPPSLYRHHDTQAKPPFLGYECHAVLKDALGGFDYYCYLEDDLLLTDPLFFRKLDWFTGLAGDEAVLQPNRFETAVGEPWHKLYIDGRLARPEISAPFQDVTDRPELTGETLGMTLRFQRVNNPHAGCFFLNAQQMARWAAQPDFLRHESAFAGPLESAATLGIMRHFRVYKPVREHAGFFEIRHLDNRYLGARLKSAAGQPRRTPT